MTFDTFLKPWIGAACRHISDGATYDILDFRLAGQNRENRWNIYGEATLYLASDHRVAVAEFARHFHEGISPQEGRSERIIRRAIARRIYDLHIRIEHALDLRDPALCAALSLDNAPYCFLDREVARTTACFLRRTTPTQAILVPSMALFDQTERYVIVLFLDKLPTEPRVFISSGQPDGVFHFGDPDNKLD
ncbi:MAG: RES domain-containing protein [Chloroflexota bacterium]|nr:RES domain-containing protein [Chloroflexota bacterium]